MLKIKRDRKYFYSILIKFIILFISIISVLSLILFLSYRNMITNTIYNSRIELLDKASKATHENIGMQLGVISTTLLSNLDVDNLLYSNEYNDVDSYILFKRIDRLISSQEGIHTAYLYNGRTNDVYIVGNESLIRRLDEFYDTDASRYFYETDYMMIPRPILRKVLVNSRGADEIYVYSFFYGKKFSNSDINSYMITINLKASDLLDILNVYNDEGIENSELFMIDKNGIINGHMDNNKLLTDISDEVYIQRVLQSTKKTGYFNELIDGKENLVLYLKGSGPFKYYINIIPISYINSKIRGVTNLTLIIWLLILILGAIIVYFLTKQTYGSISYIIENLRNHFIGSRKVDEYNDELDYIDKKLNIIDKNVNELSKFKSDNINIYRTNYLRRLFADLILDNTNVQEKLNKMDINVVAEEPIMLIMFKIDDFNNTTSNHDIIDNIKANKVMTTVGSLLEETFAVYSKTYILSLNPGEFIIIINPETKIMLDNVNEELILTINDSKDLIRNMTKLTMSVFISNVCSSMLEVNEAYNEVQELSKYKIVYGRECILNYDDLKIEKRANYDIYNKSCPKLINAIKSGSKDIAIACVHKIIKEVKSYSYDTMMSMIQYVVTIIYNTVYNIDKYKSSTVEVSYIDFQNEIANKETLEDIEYAIIDMLSNVFFSIKHHKDGTHKNIVDFINSYIAENYSDVNFSLNTIASKVKYNPSYINRLYKDYMSMSISNYISNYRIEKAKELLETTNLTIDDIIAQIGWINKKYFYTVFRKTYGVTPTQFRNSDIKK